MIAGRWEDGSSDDQQDRKVVWVARRPFKFRKCVDTGKTLWPLQIGYHQELSDIRINPYRWDDWLSPASYTFRKLRGDL